jgi:hypothetical protein
MMGQTVREGGRDVHAAVLGAVVDIWAEVDADVAAGLEAGSD